MKWIMNRISEPSSWGAIGIGIIALSLILGLGGEGLFIGLGCSVLGLILSEKAKK
jgi:hypothetical protein|tara:strand:+ start:73 stop:237 length:165 start_codon:yes stop_codon:yes gene_type:complete